MKIGFTGTRNGMTSLQAIEFVNLIKLLKPTEFHHGDCIGADFDAHVIISDAIKSIPIHIHPPKDNKFRACCTGNIIFKPKPYLERNHDIVDATDCLVAVTKTTKEELRSGTWATIRYAKRKGKQTYIIYPR